MVYLMLYDLSFVVTEYTTAAFEFLVEIFYSYSAVTCDFSDSSERKAAFLCFVCLL